MMIPPIHASSTKFNSTKKPQNMFNATQDRVAYNAKRANALIMQTSLSD